MRSSIRAFCYFSGNGYSPKNKILQPFQCIIAEPAKHKLHTVSKSDFTLTPPCICGYQLNDMYHNHPKSNRKIWILREDERKNKMYQ